MPKVFRVDDEATDGCPPIVAFLANQADKWEVQNCFFFPLKLGHSDQKRKTSIILQVLCLARVNKGAVVITEDLQVVWNDTGDSLFAQMVRLLVMF